MMGKKIFNVLPMTTFRWTKSNSSELPVADAYDNVRARAEWSGNIEWVSGIENAEKVMERILPSSYKGANEDVFEPTFSAAAEKYVVCVPAGEKGALRLQLNMEPEASDWLGSIVIHLAEKAELDLILVPTGDFHYTGQVNYALISDLEKQSKLRVTKVHCGYTSERVLEHRYTRIANEAEADFVAAEFGAKQLVYHGDADLCGDDAKISEECIYIVAPAEHVDLYYNRNHYGRKSESHQAAFGAILGNSKKVYRGCINFKRGASGAIGNEEDYVVMLSPQARNVSLPLLLCTEDDVRGNHATSAGQIDQEKLFYLMSRGFSQQDAKMILVESMLRPVVDRIKDEELRKKVLAEIQLKMSNIE